LDTPGLQRRIYGALLDARAQDRPLVVGQIGQSLDGRIATVDGHSHYINGPAGILHLHRLRALVDAVVIGVGTAVADDPRLTVRAASGPQPARVIIDPSGRLPQTARCLDDDGTRRIVVHCVERPPSARQGVEWVRLERTPEGIASAAIVTALRERGLRRLLVEGGAATLSGFLAAGSLDHLHFVIGPVVIGSGRMGLVLPPISRLGAALHPMVSVFPLPGGDVLIACDLRQTSQTSHDR